MSVSQPRPSASLDLSGLPPRVVDAVTQITAVFHRQFGSEGSAEAFEETARRGLESVPALGCELRGACAAARDDGAPRIERYGQSWVPCGAAAEDAPDLARPGALSARALPPRRAQPVADAGGRKPGSRRRLPDTAGGAAWAADAGPLHGAGSGGVLRPARRHDAVCEPLAAPEPDQAGARGKPRTARRTRSPPRSRWTASWWRGGPARTAVVRPAGARRPVARSPATPPPVSA